MLSCSAPAPHSSAELNRSAPELREPALLGAASVVLKAYGEYRESGGLVKGDSLIRLFNRVNQGRRQGGAFGALAPQKF